MKAIHLKHLTIVSAIGAAALLGAQGEAVAQTSAGCTALNGSFVGGVITGNTSGTGFSAGDTITLTVTAAGGVDALGLYNNTAFTSPIVNSAAVGTRTYTVPANTGDNFIISGGRIDAGSNFTWRCTAGSGGSASNSDSQNLTSMQQQGSAVVAGQSGKAQITVVNNATDKALNENQNKPLEGKTTQEIDFSTLKDGQVLNREQFIALAKIYYRDTLSNPSDEEVSAKVNSEVETYDRRVSSGWVYVYDSVFIERGINRPYRATSATRAQQFAPDQQSAATARVNRAFAALAYGDGAPAKAPVGNPDFTPQWSVWSDVTGAGYSQSDSDDGQGRQINATAGLSYKPRADIVLGLYAGFESFRYSFDTLAGRLRGKGGSIGAYAGWEFMPGLRWKAMTGWSRIDYDATAGTAAGDFNGSRWLVSTGLSGSYRMAAFLLEPSADIFALRERQSAYTDTLGTAHASRGFSSGRVSLGGKASAPAQGPFGATPYLGLYGDWGFSSDSATPASVSERGVGGGWSARVSGGVTIPVLTDGSLSLGGDYGGLGADYKTWSGNVRLTVPF